MAGVGARMLIVFAPQVLLYGLAVVLYGILQSYRRFGGPALAPLLSSLVVIGAYAAFGAIGGAYVFGNRLHELPPLPSTCCRAGPPSAWSRWWRPPSSRPGGWACGCGRCCGSRPGSAPGSGGWPWPGCSRWSPRTPRPPVVIVLSNRYGSTGALVIYGFAWAVFMVPYAVLAVPIATSAFPALSAGADARPDVAVGGGFDETTAISTRAVMVASWLGAAVLVGARWPLARVFESHDVRGASVLALALAAFAPGWSATGSPPTCPGCCTRAVATARRRWRSAAAGCW
jgi:hypothetical protein